MKIEAMALSAIVVLATSTSFAADSSVQPLTRADCDKAGMHWNEGANVCGSNKEVSKHAAAAAKPETSAVAASHTSGSTQKATKKTASKKYSYRKKHSHAVTQTRTTEHHPLRWLFPNAKKKASSQQ
jgi:hypothetical protein